MKSNVAGRLAAAFLDSKLTPLIMAASLGLGVWTLATDPSILSGMTRPLG